MTKSMSLSDWLSIATLYIVASISSHATIISASYNQLSESIGGLDPLVATVRGYCVSLSCTAAF